MSNKPYFLKCSHCGNIVAMVEDKGVPVMCCGEKMQPIEPNTVDAATEKHVPVVERDGDKLTVSVGEVSHPMTPEHLIEWICVMNGNRVQRVRLSAEDKPVVQFCGIEGDCEVYAYCNLHGLWKTKA